MIEYDGRHWLGTMLRLRGSVLPGVAGRMIVAVGLGSAAAWMHARTGFAIPPIAHTLLGLALGLLLVFRTNASYDRYWEGRKLVGLMVNRTRDLARQVASYLEGEGDEARAERADLGRQIAALYALIRQHLRRERDLGALGPLLTEAEREALADVACRPALLATRISRRLGRAAREDRLSDVALLAMDGNLTTLIDTLGGCERILKTPIPFAYAHHIKTFLVLFVFTAPFAMVEAMRWYTPIAAAVLAFGLFGIEEIGVEIEEPFGYDANDLPLDAIGETIERDARAVVADRDREARRVA